MKRRLSTTAAPGSGISRHIRRLAPWLLLLEAAAILILSLLPDLPQPADIIFLDKITHSIAYFVLSGTAVFSFYRAGKVWRVVVVVCCCVYGGAIELLQGLTGRTPELADLLADFAGALPGTAAGSLLYRKMALPTASGQITGCSGKAGDNGSNG